MKQRALAAAAALALGWLAALPAPAAAATHTVTIEAMRFTPATLTVRRGDRVVWRNRDVVPHTATAKGAFDSGSIAVGRSWRHVMAKPGRYEVDCTFHPGMKAVVVVQ